MQGPQSTYSSWREAASLEYNTLVENWTWEIVDLPHSEKAIGSGWVFWVKHNADGSIEHFKAQMKQVLIHTLRMESTTLGCVFVLGALTRWLWVDDDEDGRWPSCQTSHGM